MPKLIYNPSPSVQHLQSLIKDSLVRPNALSQAVRMWVVLRSVYQGGNGDETMLPIPEINVDRSGELIAKKWLKTFSEKFSSLTEGKPPINVSLKTWLFRDNEEAEINWLRSFQSQYGIPSEQLEEILADKKTVFDVTEPTIRNTFAALADKGYLKPKFSPAKSQEQGKGKGNKQTIPYLLVDEFPYSFGIEPVSTVEATYSERNIQDVIQELGNHRIGGEWRFSLNLDYVIPGVLLHRVERLMQEKLKPIWSQTPVPPIRVTYDSARLNQVKTYIIFPVRVDYVLRSIYLHAIGERPTVNPVAKGEDPNYGWYDFRLDRVRDIEALQWEDSEIPQLLKQSFQNDRLPKPADIDRALDEALGYDFYKPLSQMLVGFEQDFYERYIEPTSRKDIFKEIKAHQLDAMLSQAVIFSPGAHDYLKKLIANRQRSKTRPIVFCSANYREGDNSVIMRLRSWSPNVEVFLPWSLRTRMYEDLQQGSQRYHDMHKFI